MKFFVDTADIDEIRELSETGMLDGVTTNPSLMAKTGRPMLDVLKDICAAVDGPVSAEVTATDSEGMLREGRHLRELADNALRRTRIHGQGRCELALRGRVKPVAEIEIVEFNHRPNFRNEEEFLTIAGKELLLIGLGCAPQRPFTESTINRVGEDLAVDIGAQKFHPPSVSLAQQVPEENGNGIDFSTVGTTGAPYTDGPLTATALPRDQFRQQVKLK